jgi:hypothetical protein
MECGYFDGESLQAVQAIVYGWGLRLGKGWRLQRSCLFNAVDGKAQRGWEAGSKAGSGLFKLAG